MVGGKGVGAQRLAKALCDIGRPVVLMHEGPAPDGDGYPVVPCALRSVDDGARSLRTALDAIAPHPMRALVWVSGLVALSDVGELCGIDETAWTRLAEEPITEWLHLLQAASLQLEAASSVVLVVPSAVLVGAARLAAWTTAAEGQRSLLRAAARRWGARDVTLNCIAVPADQLVDAPVPLDRPGGPQGSLDRGRSSEAWARALAEITSLQEMTGQTIAVDGGIWMTP